MVLDFKLYRFFLETGSLPLVAIHEQQHVRLAIVPSNALATTATDTVRANNALTSKTIDRSTYDFLPAEH